jgi:RHS repeat-associated protein
MDIAGNVRGLADDYRNLVDRYHMDAFGRSTGAWSPTDNPYRFGGAWGYMTDTVGLYGGQGSGLLQVGARYYWSEIGRFIQQDPIGDGMNWYAYAGNNPLVWVDPTGEDVYAPWDSRSTWYHVFTRDPWSEFPRGAAVVADAFNPLGDWYADAGVYQRCDPIMAASRGMADMSVAALAEIPTGLALEAAAPTVGRALAGLGAKLKQLIPEVRYPLKSAGGIELRWNGGNFRAGWHKLPTKGRFRPSWARGRSLPHYHRRGPGGIGAHRPWQGGW